MRGEVDDLTLNYVVRFGRLNAPKPRIVVDRNEGGLGGIVLRIGRGSAVVDDVFGIGQSGTVVLHREIHLGADGASHIFVGITFVVALDS